MDLKRWNVTDAEAQATFPGDDLVDPAEACVRITRGIDVAAPAATVFRWLCQIKVAPYSYDLIDNGGRRSPRTLTPGVERLEVGQDFMTIFRLESFEADRYLTLRMLPPASRLFGTHTITYLVEPRGPGASRLLARIMQSAPRGPITWLRHAVLLPGDWVMMRKQLRVLKECAESTVTASGPRTPVTEPGSA